MTDTEIIYRFKVCSRAICCARCQLNGEPDCISKLNEMVIDLLERQAKVVKKVEDAKKAKQQLMRNEGKRILAGKAAVK